LLQRLQAGDEPAYRELVARWQRPILNFVFRLTGDAAAADDIAQDVFARVSRRIGSFRSDSGGSTFSAWLFQIARNAALDHLRHRRRHPTEPLEPVAGTGPLEIASSAPDAGMAVQRRELGDEIAAAVLALPEDQRAAIVLAEYEDLSVAEIAAILKSTAKSVEARLYRARQALRQRLAHLL